MRSRRVGWPFGGDPHGFDDALGWEAHPPRRQQDGFGRGPLEEGEHDLVRWDEDGVEVPNGDVVWQRSAAGQGFGELAFAHPGPVALDEIRLGHPAADTTRARPIGNREIPST